MKATIKLAMAALFKPLPPDSRYGVPSSKLVASPAAMSAARAAPAARIEARPSQAGAIDWARIADELQTEAATDVSLKSSRGQAGAASWDVIVAAVCAEVGVAPRSGKIA